MFWDNSNGNSYGNYWAYGFPFMVVQNSYNDESKLSHDEYRVFVNDNYVGNKTLISQNEKPEDLDKYLSSYGFEEFSTEINAGNIIIHSTNKDETQEIQNILNLYLNNR